MSYIDIDSDVILEDILKRKEFYTLKNKRKYVSNKDVLPLFMVEDELRKGNNLQFHSYQMFVQNFINVDTPYNRLLMKHSTGSGKTLGAIGIAMRFIKYYRMEELSGIDKSTIGSIYVIAFEGARKAFQKDLLKYPQFGFVTRQELYIWGKLKDQSLSNIQIDIDKAFDYGSKLKRRLSNRKGNGFFIFLGYKALVNRLFISDESLSLMSEEEIRTNLKSGKVKYNQTMLNGFKNSLIICDEIHSVYNTVQKNNWGVALQTILDYHKSVKAVFMSATPINNSPSEIVDLMNLLIPAENRIKKEDFFDKKKIKPGALEKLKKLSVGRVSYLVDKNPAFFPSRSFVGVPLKSVKYLKFIRCPFNEKHHKTYDFIYNKEAQTLSQDNRYLLDFILPNPEGNLGLFKTSDLKKIQDADQKWKSSHNINIVDNIPTGEFLHINNLKNVSVKYFTMMTDIMTLIKQKQGKIFIYHNFVTMSGVLFIKEILLHNGIIDEFMSSAKNTVCSICGNVKKNHTTDHTFKPARFIIAHSGLDKNTIDRSIVKYNSSLNSRGENFMILLGSRMIKESYDLKAIRHIMIVSRPDNIATLIQIMGRAVRKHSHSNLPADMRHVFIRIYTSSLPSGHLSYEELKYGEKMKDYAIIQQIEKVFHEYALDSVINHEIIKTGLESDDLGDLDFVPALTQQGKDTSFTLSTLNLNTFNVYHSQKEIDLVTYIIKRAFVETSPVWTYDDLSQYVKQPEFDVEYDTTLISDDNIVIALSHLLWSSGTETINPYIEDYTTSIDIIDKLFDAMDKRVILPNGSVNVITQQDKYYILLPLDNNKVVVRADVPYRSYVKMSDSKIDVMRYLETAATAYNYNDKRAKFKEKYKNTPIERLSDAVCDYGIDFHNRFIEDCIMYIFNSWTDWNTDKSESHDFYFKMLYYYDILGLIIFAHTSKSFIFNMYDQYILPPIQEKDTKTPIKKMGSVSEERDKQNLLNHIARNISKSSCNWCPQVTKELYEKSLNTSLERFARIKHRQKPQKIVKVQPDILPVGHFLQTVPRFYHPNKGWFSSPEYLHDDSKWIENPIIIGYHTKSKTGIHVRFKLRNPVQQIKIYKDARLIEKGSICSTKSKTFLLKLCKQLKIKINEKVSITVICNEIKARLMYLELLERSRGTRVKFFYSHFEVPEGS